MIGRSRFELVYRETSVRLRQYVTKMVGRSSQVNDIMQDAYLRLLTTAPSNLSNGQLQSYLFSTVTNIVRDSWRRGRVARKWMPLDEKTAVVATNGDNILAKIDTERALSNLSIIQRSIVWLAYAEGYSHEEIAKITNLKKNSVKVLLFRARKKLLTNHEKVIQSKGFKYDDIAL